MAIARDPDTPEFISVDSIISGRTMEPLVEIKWGEYAAEAWDLMKLETTRDIFSNAPRLRNRTSLFSNG